MGAREFAAVMDGLVTESRSSRDRAFNALDAIDRETKRNADRLCAEVSRYVAVHEVGMARLLRLEAPRLAAEAAAEAAADPAAEPAAAGPGGAAATESERDTRFDPEEEWDRSTVPTTATVADAGPADSDEDEDDAAGPTWLR